MVTRQTDRIYTLMSVADVLWMSAPDSSTTANPLKFRSAISWNASNAVAVDTILWQHRHICYYHYGFCPSLFIKTRLIGIYKCTWTGTVINLRSIKWRRRSFPAGNSSRLHKALKNAPVTVPNMNTKKICHIYTHTHTDTHTLSDDSGHTKIKNVITINATNMSALYPPTNETALSTDISHGYTGVTHTDLRENFSKLKRTVIDTHMTKFTSSGQI